MNPELQSVLDDFTQAAGLPRFDHEGLLPHAVLVDRKWIVNITEEDGRLVLFATPGVLAKAALDGATAATGKLQWFPLSCDARGCALHVGRHDPAGQVILHAAAEAATLRVAGLRPLLQDFVGQLEIWGELIRSSAVHPLAPGEDAQLPLRTLDGDWLRG